MAGNDRRQIAVPVWLVEGAEKHEVNQRFRLIPIAVHADSSAVNCVLHAFTEERRSWAINLSPSKDSIFPR